MSAPTTEHTRCKFTVKEANGDTRFLCVEPYEPGLSVLQNGSLGMWLKEGTSFDEARELASLLNEKLSTVSFMRL